MTDQLMEIMIGETPYIEEYMADVVDNYKHLSPRDMAYIVDSTLDSLSTYVNRGDVPIDDLSLAHRLRHNTAMILRHIGAKLTSENQYMVNRWIVDTRRHVHVTDDPDYIAFINIITSGEFLF